MTRITKKNKRNGDNVNKDKVLLATKKDAHTYLLKRKYRVAAPLPYNR